MLNEWMKDRRKICYTGHHKGKEEKALQKSREQNKKKQTPWP
jgi:hypothetical protein